MEYCGLVLRNQGLGENVGKMANQGLGCTDYCKFVFMNQGLGGKAVK